MNPSVISLKQPKARLFLIVLLSGLVLCGKIVAPVAQAAGPQIVASPGRVITSSVISPQNPALTVVTISNTGDSNLTVTSISISDEPSPFELSNPPALPTTIGPNSSINVSVAFRPSAAGPQGDLLKIQSNDADTQTLDVVLQGLGTNGPGGANEPSLQWILDTYQIPVTVGDPNPTTAAFATTALFLGDEVPAQRFQKAGAGNVTIEPIAVFGPNGPEGTVANFGYYQSGNIDSAIQLFSVDNASSQRLNPSTSAGSSASFDPGAASFGIYSEWPFFGDRRVYSEDVLNAWEPSTTKRHKVRVYALKEPDGTLVPNSYVVATEEESGNDNQDIVVVIRNITAVSPNLELEFNQAYPGTLFDKDSQTLGFITTQRNNNDTPTLTKSYDPALLDINTGGQGTLSIVTTKTSSAGTGQNNLINCLIVPFDGTGQTFTVMTRLVGPLNHFTQNTQQAGVMFGPGQDDFIKLIVARLPGLNVPDGSTTGEPVIEFYREADNQSGRVAHVVLPNYANIQTLDLLLIANPATGVVEAGYRIVGPGSDTGIVMLNKNVTLTGSEKASFFNQQSWAGLTVSGRDQTSATTFTFDRFAVTFPVVENPTSTATTTSTSTATSVTTSPTSATVTSTGTSTEGGTSTSTATSETDPSATPTSTATSVSPAPERYLVWLPVVRSRE